MPFSFQRILIKTIVLFFFISVTAFAENSLDKGVKLYRAGDVKQALKVLKKAHDNSPENISIIRIIGQIEAEQENWGDVKDWMSKALDMDANDVLAEYYLGIAHRESGKYKAWLLRNRDWKKSQNYFTSVINRAPTFKDIFYQYSILLRYKENYNEAIELAEKQLEILPANVDIENNLNQYYDLFLFYEDEDKVREWLVKRNNIRTRYYLGELDRRHDKISEADSIFTAMLYKPDPTISKTLIRQSLAKLRLQQEKPGEAEKFYIMAIDSAQNEVDAKLVFEDLKYILSDEEYEEYLFCKSITEKKNLFNKIWLVRNPIPASSINYRVREHIRRVLYAERYYRFDGFRTTFNNPDKLHYLEFPAVFELNNKYNDKGLIYIRHGQPDDTATELHGEGGPLPASSNVPGIIQNESWLYYAGSNNPKMMFHFVIDKDATGNNWRLIATITPDMVDSRLSWDPIFNRMKMIESQVEFIGLQHEMAVKSREYVYRGLSTDRHSWQKNVEPIQFPFYVSTFRDSEEMSRFELYYSIKFDDVWSKKSETTDSEFVTINCGLYDEDWNEVELGERKISAQTIKSATDSAGYWLDQFNFRVKPGKYRVSIAAYVDQKNKIGGYKFNSGVSSYLGKELTMSSVVLASDIKTTERVNNFYKNGLSIKPNPYLSFNKKKLVHIYYEIYNLPVVPDRNTEFNVEYNFKLLEKKKKNVISRITGLFSKSQPLTANTLERYTQDEFSAEYLALDLSKNEPGLYELEVITQVPANNKQFSRKIRFELQ